MVKEEEKEMRRFVCCRERCRYEGRRESGYVRSEAKKAGKET